MMDITIILYKGSYSKHIECILFTLWYDVHEYDVELGKWYGPTVTDTEW